MADTLIPGLIKKMQDLEKFVDDSKNDKKSITAKIIKIQQWLAGDRSLLEHRCCFAFMNFLYSSYGDDFESFEGFRAWLLCRNGMAHVKITELEKDGKLYVYQKYLVKSMSFGSCSQKEFHKYFNNLQEFAQHNWSIVFSEWKKEWDEHENTLQ